MSGIQLAEDQRRAIEEALRWEGEALANLGVLELQRREAELALHRSLARADQAAAVARDASGQCANVLRVLCAMLQLPPGEWSYDKATGQMVRKEPHA